LIILFLSTYGLSEQKKQYIGMVYIPAGEMIIGSNEGFTSEKPRHIVYIKSFYIDKYEITNGQYKIFIDATGHSAPPHWKNGNFPEGQENYPVVNVSYYDALKYAKWAGKRLPTEEEWEKAARGTDGRIYPWGNEWKKDCANVKLWHGLFNSLQPVGSYKDGVSPYGVFDLSGNVAEWTDSWFEYYPGNINRQQNQGKKYKIIRGGSYRTTKSMSQTFRRNVLEPEKFRDDLGFRCVKDE